MRKQCLYSGICWLQEIFLMVHSTRSIYRNHAPILDIAFFFFGFFFLYCTKTVLWVPYSLFSSVPHWCLIGSITSLLLGNPRYMTDVEGKLYEDCLQAVAGVSSVPSDLRQISSEQLTFERFFSSLLWTIKFCMPFIPIIKFCGDPRDLSFR